MEDIKISILETDSADYQILFNAAMSIKGVDGLTCEIGIRRGGGSTLIMGACWANNDKRIHVGIDPYGNIVYEQGKRFDYTNEMKINSLANIYTWCQRYQIDFLFFPLEDTEFFNRYNDGIPIYNQEKSIVNSYALIHFDGPHNEECLVKEIEFFKTRTPLGGIWVFDDIEGWYDHSIIEKSIFEFGFELKEKSGCKASYKKVK